MSVIHKEMTIDELLGSHPNRAQKLAQVLTNAGLHCIGCSAATWETIEAGIYSHGLEETDLNELLDNSDLIELDPIQDESSE